MEIEIYADVVCPWCYIGKRRFEQALASYDGEVTVRYRPFQLDPTPVTAPQPLLDALAAKFGGQERAQSMAGQVTQVAAEVGLTLNFDRAVSANTFDAHRLVRFADGTAGRVTWSRRSTGRTSPTGSMSAHPRRWSRWRVSVGLDETETREHLASNAGRREVAADLATAHQLGVSSVPTFVLAGKYGVTGAQEPETLLAALTEVAQRESAD